MAGDHLFAARVVRDQEALLTELVRLLDAGEPLLTLFPNRHPATFRLELPDNISTEMREFADEVAYKAEWNPEHKDFWQYRRYWRQRSTTLLTQAVKDFEAGLLGWRAIGVLKGIGRDEAGRVCLVNSGSG